MKIDVVHLPISPAAAGTSDPSVGHCLREAIPLVGNDDFAALLHQLDRIPYHQPVADAA